jgi:hypothetical protein
MMMGQRDEMDNVGFAAGRPKNPLRFRSSNLCEGRWDMAKEFLMFGKSLGLLSSLCLAAAPCAAQAKGQNGGPQDGIKQDGVSHGRSETGGQSYGDRNRGGRSGFYSYPRHRHVDGGGSSSLDRRPSFSGSAGTSPYCDNCHGSAYYGPDYGAPYFGGGYYDRGVYYRERRDWAGRPGGQ